MAFLHLLNPNGIDNPDQAITSADLRRRRVMAVAETEPDHAAEEAEINGQFDYMESILYKWKMLGLNVDCMWEYIQQLDLYNATDIDAFSDEFHRLCDLFYGLQAQYYTFSAHAVDVFIRIMLWDFCLVLCSVWFLFWSC